MNLHGTQTRAEWAVGILLAMIAGYLDGYGRLFLGPFVSFMSGNTTSTGLRSGQGDFHAAFPSAVAIVFFVPAVFWEIYCLSPDCVIPTESCFV